jgi:hypothetical protein
MKLQTPRYDAEPGLKTSSIMEIYCVASCLKLIMQSICFTITDSLDSSIQVTCSGSKDAANCSSVHRFSTSPSQANKRNHSQ